MKTYGGGFMDGAKLLELGIGSVGQNVRVHETAILIGLENMHFGSNVRVDAYTKLSATSGSLHVGSYIHIADYCYINAAFNVMLEDFAGLSQGVRIYSASDDYSGASLTNPTVPKNLLNIKGSPVTLGRHVIIGSGSVILPGVSIGEGCAIGALSVVARSLDPWGIYAGTPSRRLSERSKALLDHERILLDITR